MNFLAKKIINKLRKRKYTISVVESCTGGPLSSSLTLVPRASEVYPFVLLTY